MTESKEVFLKEDIVWAFNTFLGQLKSSEAIHPQTIRVVEHLKSQIVEIVPTHENGSPWHTGTPTEEGLYVLLLDRGRIGDTNYIVSLFRGGYFINIYNGIEYPLTNDFIVWQKIEPYRG